MANGMRPTCICQTKVFLWVRGVSVSDLQNIHKSQALSLLISGQAWATLRLILYFSAAILLIAFLMFIPAVAQLDGVVSDHWWSDCLDIPQPTCVHIPHCHSGRCQLDAPWLVVCRLEGTTNFRTIPKLITNHRRVYVYSRCPCRH